MMGLNVGDTLMLEIKPDAMVTVRCGDITLTNVTVIDNRAGQMQLFDPANGLALTNNDFLVV